jgi:cation transport regulator ChaC
MVSADMAPPSDETYRGTLKGRTPDGDPATLIVTRRAGRTWLTFLGAIKTTQVMTDDQADQLAEMIHAARGPQ